MTKINVGIDAQETNCTQLSIGSYYQITIELENVPQDREGEIENLKERLHCAVTGRDAAEMHIERLQEELAFLKAGHDKAAVVKALLAGLSVNGRLQAPPQIEAVRLIRGITSLGVKETKGPRGRLPLQRAGSCAVLSAPAGYRRIDSPQSRRS